MSSVIELSKIFSEYDFVRLPNVIEHNRSILFDYKCVRLCSIANPGYRTIHRESSGEAVTSSCVALMHFKESNEAYFLELSSLLIKIFLNML